MCLTCVELLHTFAHIVHCTTQGVGTRIIDSILNVHSTLLVVNCRSNKLQAAVLMDKEDTAATVINSKKLVF